MRKCSLSALDRVFERIAEAYKLYLPQNTPAGAEFKEWSEGAVYSDALNTVRSAKDFFFPQTENMMAFKTEGKTIQIEDMRSECEDYVIFGVRACDVRSFDILDSVFLSEPCDTFYKNRREHGVIVSMACTRPQETCFCTAFGIDGADPAGDITCFKDDSDVYFRANTEKGERLMALLSDVTSECGSAEPEKIAEKAREILKRLPLAELPLDSFGKGKTAEYFKSEKWASLSQSCLGCGTCTFVCPTCQCYDIKDFKTNDGVIRFRCWDSCMYSEFTKMAHGNSRLSQLERFRQRFMHKLVYYPENNGGVFGCVGCGRCLSKCPISMNIVKVMKDLGGKDE